MDSETSTITEVVETILQPQSVESSIELPPEQWSSLEIVIPEENKKKLLYDDGLYDPGSGEICAKYITISASSILRHPYYNYPAIKDPGIEEALLKPEKLIVYPDDGQELYLATCREMNQCPVRSFYKGLLDEEIDLRYYCVSAAGIRAMAIALRYNKTVKTFNLTDNFLNDDASYHLGEMLLTNNTINYLILRGCRIGPTGVLRLFSPLPNNRGLQNLDLSYNQIGDEGMEHIAKAVFYGLEIKNINLSYNNITGKGVMMLAEPFETNNKFTHINLSWNKVFTPGSYAFLLKLSESTCLQELNLSWNSLSGARLSLALKEILLCPLLRDLNLSNNKLEGEAIVNIIANLGKAKKLVTLNLSYNPLTPADAMKVLNKVKSPAVKLQRLYLDNVFVAGDFLNLLARMRGMKSKKNIIVTYGGVVGSFIPKGPDIRELILNRVEFLTKRSKKHPTDIALIALQLQKDNRSIINVKDFLTIIQASGAPLDENLVDELCMTFPGPRTAKFRTVNIDLLVEYIQRKWPDRKLPPTPPPEPEPEPEPPPKKGKKDAKKKGKGKK
ncbi:unnamed protein product [Spodoptera littoralis]|uniref:Uncharacterized protein n=1 Tax=Spodoptera littoralis TaxID=7109 RepID=A0A9P0N8Y5_SPOLI|nr:unnamed protein product [Spodoptera littoralis]CAH1645834.1 unnamed protein product [Spodoptera littoralis]